MYKKSLIILSTFIFVLCITAFSVFATDNTADNIKNGVSSVTNTVVDGVNRMGSDVRNGVGSVENGIEDALTMDNKTTDMAAPGTTTDYTATRTTADVTTDNNTANLWVWMIVAVAAIVIVGLVWYYGTRNTTHHDE